ncbi:hypothetical protein IAI10_13265 [Clostridium sp. 19966]|uniref:hypothetical protein n=1 Tax=Clostridium sp. 19966 TaxID=2768166 RepID=UPI0028DEF429|nr:hypothetical protein [Clostridium sp. 19966]MDT8717636.1 hypothetical protein [Clostridium sp. 19966]
MDENRSKSKKRIMFIESEDYYFITYNLLLILYKFNCLSIDTAFKYPEKLASLIYFISNYKNINLFKMAIDKNIILNSTDKERILDIYAKSKIIKKDLLRILFALERKKIINLIKNDEVIEVSVNMNSLGKDFFKNRLFNIEMDNIDEIKKIWSRLRTVKYSTYYDKIFKENGVAKWDS